MTAFGGMSRDPDEVMAGIDKWAQGFAEKAQRYQAAQQRTEELRLTATSSDGVVKVTVGADGNVTSLVLDAKIRSMPPETVSAQILETMRRAQSGIADKVSEVMTESLGNEDAETRAELLGTLRARFPEMEDEEDADEPNAEFGRDTQTPDEPPPAPPAPPQAPPPPARPQGRHRAASDDDEDTSPW